MSEEKKVPEVTPEATDSRQGLALATSEETPETTGVEETITEQSVEEVADEVVAEAENGSVDTVEAEESAEETTEVDDTPDEGEPQIEDFINSIISEDKDNTQKRIDDLTSEKYQLLQKIEALEKNTKTDGKVEKKYSDAELDAAEKEAIEDNDLKLLNEVHKQRLKNIQSDLAKKLEDEKTRPQKEQEAIVREYEEVCRGLAYLADDATPEIYPGSRAELNLASENSLIYQIARNLYLNPKMSGRYRRPGGQQIAANDALKAILNKRLANKPEDKEKKMLKRKVVKAEQKGIVPNAKSAKAEEVKETPKRRTPKQRLDDFAEESKRF